MVYIPRFYLDEVINGASHTLHPAFIANDRELDGIFVSKFQNTVIDGRAYSLPDRDLAVNIDYDTAERICNNTGEGFHLMTAAEWGRLLCYVKKTGGFPMETTIWERISAKQRLLHAVLIILTGETYAESLPERDP